MNANFVFVLFTIIFFALVSATPIAESQHPKLNIEVTEEEAESPRSPKVNFDHEITPVEHGARFQRATCDLLSASTPWVTLNHSACAAHCLAMRKGFRGGRCRNGVCHCRR